MWHRFKCKRVKVMLTYILRSRSPRFHGPVILPYILNTRGWSGGAKVLCILHHWGVQLILAYSWARPAILVVGKGRGGMFLFLLFLHFHSCSSFFPVPLFHLLYSLFYLFSPFLWETTQNDPQGNPNTINQILNTICWINVTPGILLSCDPMNDHLLYLGHCDLYFMLQWFCLISWILFVG